ncbi:hypothetical protein FPF71_03820 [Algibacter amylolyticus]|uniref:Uncharacterized protein n=1 Tax=Algibacter amylolyticus TaxID=1608400 RepID=A0A5M7BEH1_9FLAO|nr:hypothetical protein [Algibacter amylolyticus]KAA5827976.1 hypothetical protein F2B50_03820 [Algibacter amylolyticus]MBB5267215.1 hypothetical protein [Algibacter amylolyticus]TSJ82221.1 hypothetical protein FPF71_03820 [Algibacter amylolyticus]
MRYLEISTQILNRLASFKILCLLGVFVFCFGCKGHIGNNTAVTIKKKWTWETIQQIVDGFEVSKFQDNSLNYDAISNNPDAFKKAIQNCFVSGRGRVDVSSGKLYTGLINLKSKVNFHIFFGKCFENSIC